MLVLCGPGNNGGDGFVAAALLRAEGRKVRAALLGDRTALRGDAAEASAAYDGPVEVLGPSTDLQRMLSVDALFGAGLDRPLRGDAAAVVDAPERRRPSSARRRSAQRHRRSDRRRAGRGGACASGRSRSSA